MTILLFCRRFRPLGVLRRLRLWPGLARQRCQLGRLDEDRLRDIGLSEVEARREAARPVWDAPAHWRR